MLMYLLHLGILNFIELKIFKILFIISSYCI